MKTNRLRFSLLLCVWCLLAACHTQAPLDGPVAPVPVLSALELVPAGRLAHLARGINIQQWFFYPMTDPGLRMRDADFDLLKKLGFTYIRLPVELPYVYDGNDDGRLIDGRAADVEKAVRRILDHGLAVCVDIHTFSREGSDKGMYTAGLEGNPAAARRFRRVWERFAARLAVTDPERVVLELMNEPCYPGRHDEWYSLQAELAAIVRSRAPRHTIIATCPNWSSLFTLVDMQPLADPNIVYAFHFYEPVLFVNQGVDWSVPLLKELRNVPYPAEPQTVQDAVRKTANPLVAAWLTLYGNERWNGERLAGLIGQAAAWGEKHGVPVICNEFGVYQRYAAPQDRFRWVADVRRAFDACRMGWALWAYDEADKFALVDRRTGSLIVDEGMARALNLNGYAPAPSSPEGDPAPRPAPAPTNVCEEISGETRQAGERVKVDGFSFLSPGGFEMTSGPGYAFLISETGAMEVFLIRMSGILGQTTGLTLDYLLGAFKNLDRARLDPVRAFSMGRYQGLAANCAGRLSGTFLKGRIAVVNHGSSFFLSMGFAMSPTGEPVWDDERRALLDNLLDSVELFRSE